MSILLTTKWSYASVLDSQSNKMYDTELCKVCGTHDEDACCSCRVEGFYPDDEGHLQQ
jgi:hypothetical protein